MQTGIDSYDNVAPYFYLLRPPLGGIETELQLQQQWRRELEWCSSSRLTVFRCIIKEGVKYYKGGSMPLPSHRMEHDLTLLPMASGWASWENFLWCPCFQPIRPLKQKHTALGLLQETREVKKTSLWSESERGTNALGEPDLAVVMHASQYHRLTWSALKHFSHKTSYQWIIELFCCSYFLYLLLL